MDLRRHLINGPPQAMYYVPNFITEEEEEAILSKIPANRWTSLAHRRLQAIPTQLTAGNVLLASELPEGLQRPAINRISAMGFFDEAPHGINHCLVNEYLPGQGIMPHEDGPAYHPVVATVSLGGSLVLDVVGKTIPPRYNALRTAPNPSPVDDNRANVPSDDRAEVWRILQEPRSLLVTTGSAYTDTMHGIAEVEEDCDLNAQTVANWSLLGDRHVVEAAGGRNLRSKRVSLTFRDVKRVSTLGSRLLGRGRP